MNNGAIAQVFQDMADLLELKEENPFKIRAYERAAHTIISLPTELEHVMQEGKLREIPGIGEAIASKITELLSTGRVEAYERLRAEFPETIGSLMSVPGVGPRIAGRLYRELGVSTVEELESAILDGRVADMYRLGEKKADSILRHIQSLRRKDQRVPLGEALPVAEHVIGVLEGCAGVRSLVAAGSLRRFRETVGDIDIMGTADSPAPVIEAFVSMPEVEEVLAEGTTKASVVMKGGPQVDLRLVEHESFGSLLQHFTGSKEHNVALRDWAVRRGLSLSEYGITVTGTGETHRFDSEEKFYEWLGLQIPPPELREGGSEVELAERWELPPLVELADIRGDLHAHTEWSDGYDTIQAMAEAARAKGYSFLAITDHSGGRGIAGGLSAERLREQIAAVREVDGKLRDLRLFAGSEVDIRADGSLDYEDDVLAELDVVIAAVHSAMEQDRGKMTARIVRAVENPRVRVLAHPTCRLIGVRDPVDVDLDEVFRAAVRTNTAIEINAMPNRLDLKDTHVKRALEMGVKLAIGTDAHSVSHLDLMRFGVGVARRGWCRAGDILNTWPLDAVEAFLKRGVTDNG